MIRPLVRRIETVSVLLALSLVAGQALAAPLEVRDAHQAIPHLAKARGILVGLGSAMPTSVVTGKGPLITAGQQHLAARGQRLPVYWAPTMADGKVFSPEAAKVLDHRAFFVTPSMRAATTAGRIERVEQPNSLFDLGKRIKAGQFSIDTVLVRVSPPNEKGEVSLGPDAALTRVAVDRILKKGGQIIAEVHPYTPFIASNTLKKEQLTVTFPGPQLLLEEPPGGIPTPITEALARQLIKLVPKGATVQVGYGGAAASLGQPLVEREIAGLFSEMLGDWSAPVIGQGLPTVGSFIYGSNMLYQMATMPNVEMRSIVEVNDPAIIAGIPKMVAMNTALQVRPDTGDANATEINGNVISMQGGQLNFMEGAARAKDGRPIIFLRSTSKYGDSTLTFDLAGPVTTPGKLVGHVVTEWGRTPELRKLTPQQRTFEMAKIAHPLLRKDLAQQAQKRGLLTEQQVAKVAATVAKSVAEAPAEMHNRRYIADQALARQLIDAEQHGKIVQDLQATEPGWAEPPPSRPEMQPHPVE